MRRILRSFHSRGLARCMGAAGLLAVLVGAQAQQPPPPLDPAAWGEDHVGKPLPDYVTGDECLFCHRNDIGPVWDKDPHARTVYFTEPGRPPLDALEKVPGLKELAGQAALALGREHRTRLLKQSADYGKLDISSVEVLPAKGGKPAEILHAESPAWDGKKFAAECAGCHATAVEAKSLQFAAFSLDCYSCHGDVSLTHTEDPAKILLSLKREDEPRVVASICGQCHLRGGKSRSVGTPYASQFVAGDNLFKDFEADLSAAAIAKLDPGERHIRENIRAIVVEGRGRVTCLSCHEVHANSSKKHLGIGWQKECATCHPSETDRKKLVTYERKSALCGY